MQIWFAFRTLMAAGNLVKDPLGDDSLALFSVFSVVLGMFILAFFIGIGSSIISGLMGRLRNERLMIANHLVMIGWNRSSPYIIQKLKLLSDQRFASLKLVFLGQMPTRPPGLESWVTFRWGDTEDAESMHRVNLGSARQALICTDDSLSVAEELSQNMFSLMAIRQVNPDIPVSYTVMGMVQPRLKSYRHMLQIGWDKVDYYKKPTVLISEPDMRANLIRNVLVYQDVDQVLSRLMIPEREEESAMHVVEWRGRMVFQSEDWFFVDGMRAVRVSEMMRRCFEQGVILVAVADAKLHVHPLTLLHEDVQVTSVLGIAVDNASLYGEFEHCLHMGKSECAPPSALAPVMVMPPRRREVRLLAVGWIGTLPLMLKRLLDSYEIIHLMLLDEMGREQLLEMSEYVHQRVAEMAGAASRLHIEIRCWDFSDMEVLREHVRVADKLIVSRPARVVKKPHAMVAAVLSHTFTLAEEEASRPEMFAIVDTRNQARMLQKELDRFPVDMDVNVVVPLEFYGTYAAHTSYLMYASATPQVYDMHRSLRYLLDSLMGDDAEESLPLALDVLPCPHSEEGFDASELFARLLQEGLIWIGFRIDTAIASDILRPNPVMRLFPRRYEFRCLRQMEIMINPLGNPQSLEIWKHYQPHIVELIVIRRR